MSEAEPTSEVQPPSVFELLESFDEAVRLQAEERAWLGHVEGKRAAVDYLLTDKNGRLLFEGTADPALEDRALRSEVAKASIEAQIGIIQAGNGIADSVLRLQELDRVTTERFAGLRVQIQPNTFTTGMTYFRVITNPNLLHHHVGAYRKPEVLNLPRLKNVGIEQVLPSCNALVVTSPFAFRLFGMGEFLVLPVLNEENRSVIRIDLIDQA